ncbi:MAG: hypothetical protein MH204_11525, partial [Fimbriimonadaceae bacterium]|nr:hypothetical protein [Fimbriimonadaceae bacterium]
MNRLLLRIVLPLLILGSAGSAALAQSSDSFRVTIIQEKLRRLDLLNLILPVLMTRDQLGEVLKPIDAARKAKRDLEAKELELLKRLEREADAAYKNGVEKQQVVPGEMIGK